MIRLALLVGLAACWTRTSAPPPPPPLRPAPLDRFHDLAVDALACRAAPRPRVERAAALADLEVVERVLRRGYVGFGAERAWRAAFDQLRARVEHHADPIAADDLATLIADTLAGVAEDPSLTIAASRTSTPHAADAHAEAYTVDLELERRGRDFAVTAAADASLVGTLATCDGATMAPVLAAASHPILRPIAIVPVQPDTLSCTFNGARQALPTRRLALPAPEPVRSARVAFELAYHSGIPVLRVRSFDGPAMKSLLVAAKMASHGTAFVLDLRGNTGGDREVARQVIREAMPAPLTQPTLDELTSEVTLQGELAAATCALADADPEAHEELEVARSKIRARLDTAAALATPPHAITHLAVAPFPIEVHPGTAIPILIVDRACGGACEDAVFFARQHPRAVVIGEPTAGTLAFDLPRSYRLSASGLWISVPTRRKVADTIGHTYIPDLFLDEQDLDTALAPIITCAQQRTCIGALRP